MQNDRNFKEGDLVKHFKRELVEDKNSNDFIYRIITFAKSTYNGEILVIYQGLYSPFDIWARPMSEFESEVDKNKYPDIKQKYRFVKIDRYGAYD